MDSIGLSPKAEEAIEQTQFSSIPPEADNYKFVLNTDGTGVFWIPPFEMAGGKRWGELWDRLEDSPIHGEVTMFLEWTDEEYAAGGYCVDGEVQVNGFVPVSHFSKQILEWWPDKEYIEWDGEEVPIQPDLLKSASKKQKQRKRRNKNKQRTNVPYYYGSWWGGWNPGAVFEPGDFHDGGGTTENSTGGDFGGV